MQRCITSILLITLLNYAEGQICCTAGTPIAGNFNISTLDKGRFSINSTLDLNIISDLLIEDAELKNDNISRVTTTFIGQFNYSFNRNGVVSLIVPYNWTTENTSVNGINNKSTASGVGDIALAYFHRVEVSKRSQFHIGGALKVPSGATQIEDLAGITLQPTLQPGTGSVDLIYATQFQFLIKERSSTRLSQLISYRSNGETNIYTFHDSYRFGDEFQSITTISSQVLISETVNTPFIAIQYINQDNHLVDGYENINTGGNWVYLNPGWILAFSEQINCSINYVFPVYRSVNGFQLATSSRLVATAAFTIK